MARRKLSPGARRVVQGFLIGSLAVVLTLALWLPGWLEGFEARTWDLRARLFEKPGPATSQVVTILLDQKSLEWGKKENGLSWPWPREVYTAITDFCARAGARALVLDVFYTEPSVYGVSDDQAFAAGLQNNGHVVAAMNFGSEQATDTAWPADDARAPLVVNGLEDWIHRVRPSRLSFPRAEFPIPEVFKNAAVMANAYLGPDAVDRVYRRGVLFNTFDGRVVPTEALAAYQAGSPGPHTLGIAPGLLTVDGRRVPIDSEGRAILRFRGPSTTHRAFTAAAIVQADLQLQSGDAPGVDPAALKDKYVFFGFSAPGLFDLKPSP
ncbi:MAG TPA: CHASE2 domain-containing protein, partial [Spirochaetia bacterium]|nr:CHASE2 domain-containing protein [Spirochaetia bacterium]